MTGSEHSGSGRGRIALVRHGETEWSRSGRHTSRTDVDLTPRGVTQATLVPATLRFLGIRPAAVLVSPRLRAQRTAQLAGLVAAGAGTDPNLAEWSYGRYEGLTSAEIEAQRPGWSLFADGAPDGETPTEVGARADRVLERARTLLDGGDVVMVCHGHISRVLAARWVGLDASGARILLHDPACVTVLGWYHGRDPILDHVNVPPPESGSTEGARP